MKQDNHVLEVALPGKDSSRASGDLGDALSHS